MRNVFEEFRMIYRCRSLRVAFAEGLRKAVMKNLTNWAIGSCLVAGLALTAQLGGQTATLQTTAGGISTGSSSGGQLDSAPGNSHLDNAYVIGDDDVLSISVWKEPDLTKVIPVRSDGKISLPLVGDVQAAGLTPAQLAADLTAALGSFITDPQVTVIVQEIRSRNFNILGQVIKPGSYPLTVDTTVVDAIALAGGFRDFAKKKGIYVVRQGANGAQIRLPFNYEDFIKGKKGKKAKHVLPDIEIKPHDTIVVP
jgi:polysaccharide export outer membrane protein